jgi:hypothetical protein
MRILELPTFFFWCVIPMILYAIERTIRLVKGSKDTIIHVAAIHPSKVIELQLKTVNFTYQPGQYLFLNCPFIAPYEWQ